MPKEMNFWDLFPRRKERFYSWEELTTEDRQRPACSQKRRQEASQVSLSGVPNYVVLLQMLADHGK